jgi:hypothetical protein
MYIYICIYIYIYVYMNMYMNIFVRICASEDYGIASWPLKHISVCLDPNQKPSRMGGEVKPIGLMPFLNRVVLRPGGY